MMKVKIMAYKNSALAAVFAAMCLAFVNNAHANTIYIQVEPAADIPIQEVRGVAEVSKLPLIQVIKAEVERPLEDVSLSELSMVETSSNDVNTLTASAQNTVSAPVVASYNNPSNNSAVPSSVVASSQNNTATPSMQTTIIISNNQNTAANNQIVKGVKETVSPHFEGSVAAAAASASLSSFNAGGID